LKKTIHKYSSLLALLGAPFFSSQTVAAECATGTSPVEGCTIDLPNITYTLTGDIEPDPGDNGIRFNSDNVTLNLTGGILGINQGRGLFYFNDFSTTTMIGDITVGSDAVSAGIQLNGANNNVITQTGDISTSGRQSTGVFILGSDNTINITGDMTSSGNSSPSFDITLGSSSNTINMTGNITSSGNFSHGFILDQSASSNTINMTGNITTTGGASGFKLDDSESNTINMTGNINTSGDVGVGIWLNNTSHRNVISMTGDIVTSGANADAILASSSDGNTITMTGNIQTSGTAGRGYVTSGSFTNNTTINGDITTTGDSAEAIYMQGGWLSTTTITGNISTTGQQSEGVYLLSSDENTLVINGNIITSGTDGDSEPILLSDSDSNTFTLSGAVHSLGGDQAIALDATSQNNTFTFKRGVSFIGGLENNGGTTNKLIFDMGKASSYNLDFDETTWTIQDLHKPIVSGSAKSMGVSDIDNQAHILYRRMDPVNDVLSERQRLYKAGQRPTGYYIDSYYGHDKRNEDYSEISGNAGGMTVGYVLENTNTPMEVLVNFEVSQDNYGAGLAKQTTETNSVMAGLFLPALAEDVLGGNISAKVLVSGSDNDANRTVLNNSLGLTTASEKVSGDYNSGFISVGGEWLTEFLKVERVRHDISIGADLVQAYNEDYTAGEYKVDERNMTQIQSRILYGMTYKNAKKTVDVNTRFGIANQHMLSGEKQDYKINGTSASYTGDDNSFYYTAGLGAKYYLADNTNLYVDTKYGQSSDDIQNMTIDFGFISRF